MTLTGSYFPTGIIPVALNWIDVCSVVLSM
jgi:hypothetical protein